MSTPPPIRLPTDWPDKRPRSLPARMVRRVDVRLRRGLPRPVYHAVRGGYYGARTLVGRNPGRGRVLPDYLIIGVAKGGTTSLCGWLNEHPFVSPAARKEVHFFDYEYHRGVDWYRSNFPLEEKRREFAAENGEPFLTGEASPTYISHLWAPHRVAKLLPDAKLVVALRNPVDRAYSHFQMTRREGYEPFESFEEAVAAEEDRLAPETERLQSNPRYYSWWLGSWSYLERSRYAEQLERWLELFPREQFLFVRSEDLSAEPARTLDTVHEFLGLPPHRRAEYPHLHTAEYDGIPADTRLRLAEYFRPHNERLYELAGIDFGWE